MSSKMGCPVMHCDARAHAFNDKHGNYKSVIEEAFENEEPDENGIYYRRCSDPDYDRRKTCENVYLTDLKDAQAIEKYIDDDAMTFRRHTKDGKEKKLASNAVLYEGLILKPDIDFIESLGTREAVIQYFKDCKEVLDEDAKKRGFDIISFVIHFDEGNAHVHGGLHDKEYRLSKKCDIFYKNWLNYEFPVIMKERYGYDLQPLDKHYDAEYAKTLSPQGKEYYIEKVKEEKKQRVTGLSSEAWKVYKENEKLKSENAKLKQDKEQEINDINVLQTKKKLDMAFFEGNRQNHSPFGKFVKLYNDFKEKLTAKFKKQANPNKNIVQGQKSFEKTEQRLQRLSEIGLLMDDNYIKQYNKQNNKDRQR